MWPHRADWMRLIALLLTMACTNRCAEGRETVISESTTRKPADNRWNITEPPLVKVNSKRGRALARMQSKRQVEDAGQWAGSRRNEDPWFLDQPPYPLQPYRFVYNIKGKNGQTEQYRQEVGDGKFLTGSYGYVLPDGIYRHVDYVADERGFRAFIRTSEPGTANENPANVVIAATPVTVAPGVTYARQSSAGELPVAAPPTNFYSPPTPTVAPLEPAWARLQEAGLDRVRRPPGSIVNTPARNFSSYSFTTPPPLAPQLQFDREPSGSDLAKVNQRQSSAFNQAHRLFQQQADEDDQFGRPARPSPSRPQTGPPPSQQVPFVNFYQPPSTTPLPFSARPLPVADRSERGGLLTYDQPLVVQGNTNTDSNKLSYDNKHTSHPEAPLLALERARALAQLERFNAAGVGSALRYLRPAQPELGVLAPPQPSQFEGQSRVIDKHRAETSSTSRSSQTSSSSSASLGPDGRLVPLGAPAIFNQQREQSSGSKSGSVRELELYQHRAGQGSGQPDQDAPLQLIPLPPSPPPQPTPPAEMQLTFPPREPESPRPSSGGTKGRLQAPYANFNPQPSADEKQPEAGSKTSANDKPAEESNVEREPTKRHLSEPSWFPEQLRSVRAPAARDFRSSLAMTDLRSMQNMIGLPQPPRVPVTKRAGPELAEQLVRSSMSRAEELLSKAGGNQGSHTSPASSTRRTVVSESNEIEQVSTKPKASALRSLRERLQTGPVIRLDPNEEPPSLADSSQVGANDTLQPRFDARRLSSRDRQAAKLQAEKVSELEKFQQRLRTQQLLLEQQAKPLPVAEKQSGRSRSGDQVNSHVSYDDAPEEANEVSRPSGARPRRQNELASGAQVAPSSTTSATTTSTTSTTTPLPPTSSTGKPKRVPSELAKEIRSWPSVAESGAKKPPSSANKSQEGVNMEFLNSVASLAADQLNPFASRGGVATSNARYFSSPELLAASEDPTRREASARLLSLFGASDGAPNNHRAAPYMASDSQPSGRYTPTPASAGDATGGGRHRSADADVIEVRDRALELDRERFYEVVSSADPAAPVAGPHRAFRG